MMMMMMMMMSFYANKLELISPAAASGRYQHPAAVLHAAVIGFLQSVKYCRAKNDDYVVTLQVFYAIINVKEESK